MIVDKISGSIYLMLCQPGHWESHDIRRYLNGSQVIPTTGCDDCSTSSHHSDEVRKFIIVDKTSNLTVTIILMKSADHSEQNIKFVHTKYWI